MPLFAGYLRKPTLGVKVGSVQIGGGAPVVVQSMTNTDTSDIEATVQQVALLAERGSELVRITVDKPASAAAVPHIRDQLDQKNISVPLIGDFHYNGHTLLRDHPACAEALGKYRINPGNVGFGEKQDRNFSMMIDTALRYEKPIRIGVNWGSLDQAVLAHMMDENSRKTPPLDARLVVHKALVHSAVSSAQRAVALGLAKDRIVLSAKVSEVQDLILVYQSLAQETDHALHLGLTEAGTGSKGIVASTAGLSVLLQQGIGDTIRISLTPKPHGDRGLEVLVAQEILQTMGLRAFMPTVIACPGCGRTTSTVFQELAYAIQNYLLERTPHWRLLYPGFENLQVAVMGCIVNGPGESKHADIGISLPGTGEIPAAPVYIDGKKVTTLRGDTIGEQFQTMVEAYVLQRWGNKVPPHELSDCLSQDLPLSYT